MAIYIGGILRRRRKAKGLSQEKLAFESGLDRSYIGDLERNEKSPSLDTVFKISKVLEIKPDEFVKEVRETLEDYNTSEDNSD
ncbi:helix-turn-helix domain-containing protein [Neobacillus rhizophilus]|uniref:helix-turn-helix domain-containing protein n=1 Tax=Neobacillus rhizophilus TaxID=2833579 RepID=UPI0020171F3A|nr:helix-turn-helix transcriptional regulator [Neobacillus rhizophilus]